MKLWYLSLALSILSCLLLGVSCLLPAHYTVFDWSAAEVQAGVLFPVLLVSWTLALFGFLFNNIFIDRNLVEKGAKTLPPARAYLPTYLGLPAFISFCWFIIRWYKGKPEA